MFSMPELVGLTAVELDELLAAVRVAAADITDALADPELADLADLDELEALAGHVETIVAAQTALATIAAERAEKAAALAARINPVAEADPEPETEEAAETEGAESEEGAEGDASAEAVAEVIAEAEAATETAPVPVVAAVVHNVTSMPPPRSVAKLAPKPKPNKVPAREVAIVAAAGVPGLRGGQEATLGDFVKPAVSRWASYPDPASGFVGRIQDELYSLMAPARDPRLIADGRNDQDVIDYAISQERLAPLPNAPAGATGLVAAGGWCAPAEQRYDICTLAAVDGIYDVPTISMPRGSISYFRQLDYSTVCTAIAAGEFTFTNAQLVAEPPVVKPCFEIPCQTPVTATLDVVGLCIRAGLLQQKAFPELIEAWMRLALICFAHYRNKRNLAQVIAGSGAPIVMPATFGAISPLLDAIALQAMNYRFDNGMSMDATLEVVLPWWVPALLQVDQERRQFGSDDALDWASDLGELNVRAQYVKDFDDAPFAGGAPVTAWPATVQFLMYAPGAWLRGTEDIITVSSLVDSTLLQTNRIQLLFFEAADVMLPACGPSILVQVPVCPSGATSGPIAAVPGSITCPAA